MDPNAQQPQASQPTPEAPHIESSFPQELPAVPQIAPADTDAPAPVVADPVPVTPLVQPEPVLSAPENTPPAEQPLEPATLVGSESSITATEPAPVPVEPLVEQPSTAATAPEPTAPLDTTTPVEPPVAPEPPVETTPVIPEPAALPQFPTSLDETAPVPIPQPAPQPAPLSTPVLIPVVPVKKKTALVIGLIVGGIILLVAGAVAVWYLVVNSGKVSEADLVTAKIDNTVYLRPKQWQVVTINSLSGYGDKRGKDNTSTALITVEKKAYLQPGVKSASASELDTFREAAVTAMTQTEAITDIKNEGGSCTSTEDVTVTKSSASTTNMVGILRIEGICVRDDGRFKVVIYAALGEDGYLRSVIIMSTESLWKLNEAVFNKMLESTNQV